MAVIKTEDLTYVYGDGTPFRKVAVDHDRAYRLRKIHADTAF